MNKLLLVLLFLININSLYSFPGDQDPLSCTNAFSSPDTNGIYDMNKSFNARQKILYKGLIKDFVSSFDDRDSENFTYESNKNKPAYSGLTEQEYKDKRMLEATKEYTDKIRAYHNPSKRVTKLGDSLSDFVDFYGVNV